jgi:Putative beta-lactamase-inhibitor-like, PepSY-like
MSSLIRLITLAAVFAWLTPGLQGQDEKVDIDKLPAKVAATLEAKFPGAQITTATKTIENGEVIYDIEMTRRGKKHEMDVKEDGVIVNFENQIAVSALPAAVAAAVKTRYPKCTIKEAMEVMVIKGNKDVVDEYEVLIETAEKKELELTVSPDGKKIE